MKIINNKSWFSVVVAILVSAFLIVISMWVLDLILGEQRITRTVSDTISTYAWAEGSLELALLWIMNHREGFFHSLDISQKTDKNVNILAKDPEHLIEMKEQRIGYDMETQSKNYTGTALKDEFVIIPLFFDKDNEINKPSTKNMEKTTGLDVVIGNDVIWNIIGNNTEGDTLGLVGIGRINGSTTGKMKQVGVTNDNEGNKIGYSPTKWVSEFMIENSDNYLILYSNAPIFDYTIRSNNGFSLPKISVTASSQIDNFKQNILFVEDKSRIFDALKYSVFGAE